MKNSINISRALSRMKTNKGRSVEELSAQKPVLLVFLRNFGCTFCRQALSDIRRDRELIQKNNTQIVLVHLNDEAVTQKYMQRYELMDVERVMDKHMKFYADFGLVKGNFKQLFGLQNWIKGFESAVVNGHGISPPIGDGLQMPGVFLIDQGQVVNEFIHKSASDRPDYVQLSVIKKKTSSTPVS